MAFLTHFKGCRMASSVANANNFLTQVMSAFLCTTCSLYCKQCQRLTHSNKM